MLLFSNVPIPTKISESSSLIMLAALPRLWTREIGALDRVECLAVWLQVFICPVPCAWWWNFLWP